MARIAIFGALRWECNAVLGALPRARRERLHDLACWRAATAAAEILVVQTGMGQERAGRAAACVADSGGFDLFLSSGCAGGLDSTLAPGTLVVATEVTADSGSRIQTDPERRNELLEAAHAAGLVARPGRVLSIRGLLLDAKAKVAAHREHGALVVEMEGAAIAAVARARGIPFASVRTILDPAQTNIDLGVDVIDPTTGSVKPLRLLLHLVAHPEAVGPLREMQQLSRAAQASLDRFFAAWLHPREHGDPSGARR